MEVVMSDSRITHLRQSMQTKNLEAVALLPGPSLFYLTGLSFHMLERPIVAIFPIRQNPLFIVPDLELSKVENCPLELDILHYGEDQASRLEAFELAGEMLRLEGARIGIEPLIMRAFELRLLEGAIPGAKFVSADDTVSSLRLKKDDAEIESMRMAVKAAETALREIVAWVRPGLSEKEIASELIVQLLRAGSESEIPFNPIVSSGPNSAFVHATPSDRKLQVGDILMIDFGARVKGYVSDITRTFAIGELNEEMKRVYEVVQEANAEGKSAVKIGAQCSDVDRAARSVIDEAGYGEYFLHRTGHGIGLEGHEGPYIAGDNQLLLSEGMTFTVEPGLYIPNQGGVRIEDNVVVTSKGMECLTTYPRELQVIGS
jgi:Xaa-Pro dipeptidase